MRGLWRWKNLLRSRQAQVIHSRFLITLPNPQQQQQHEIIVSGYSELRKQLDIKPKQCINLVEQWLAKGNHLTLCKVTEIFDLLDQIRERRAALDWISYVRRHQKAVEFTPDLCIRVLATASFHCGPGATVCQYEAFPTSSKTELVTAALVSHLVKAGALLKADKWVKTLPKFPQTTKVFNVLLSYYLAKEMHEHFLTAFNRLKKTCLQPNLETYLLLLRFRRRVGGNVLEENVEQEAREVVSKLEVDACKNKTFLGVVMEVHAHLGQSEAFEEVWKMLRSLSFPRIPSVDNCKSAFAGFEMLGHLEKAEELANQMLRHKKSASSPYFEMVEIYGKLGMVDRMNEVLRETPDGHKFICNSLIVRYLSNGEMERGVQLQAELNWSNTINVASYEAVLGLLSAFEERKDVWRASRMMQHYLECSGRHGDVNVYNKLVKVYVASGSRPDRLLKEGFPELVPNEKTLLLLMRAEYEGDVCSPRAKD